MTPAADAALSRRDIAMVGLLWAALATTFVLANLDAIASMSLPDSDDYLRLQQVRDWLAGQSWFDTTQHRISPPDGGALHWSRVADLPIALGIALLSPLVGQPTAELLVCTALPLIVMLLAMLLAASITARLFSRTWAPLAAAAIPLSALIYPQIMPLRIDHHGWQIVLALLLFWALLDETHKRRSGVIAGVAAALWLNISIEGLPIVTCAALILGVRWLADARELARLQAYLWALTIAAALSEAATMPSALLVAECDRLSQPYLATLAVASLAAAGAGLGALQRGWRLRLLFGVVAGAAACSVFASVGPACLEGPFADLDPLSRALWLDRVGESLPLIERGAGAFIANAGFWIVGCAGAAFAFRAATGQARVRWATALTLIVTSGALMFVLSRTGIVAHAFAAPGAAVAGSALLARARASQLMPLRAALTAFAILAATPALLRPALLLDAQTRAIGATDPCTIDAQTLDAIPPSILLTSVDLGARIVAHTPHSVMATPHHRNHAAISDVLFAFTAPPEAARARIEARRARYVVLCPTTADVLSYVQAAPDGLAARLLEGRAVPGFERVEVGARSGLLVFAVGDAGAPELRGRFSLHRALSPQHS